MNTVISALANTGRSIRRSVHRLVTRLTRNATIKLAVTLSLSPFLKVVFGYELNPAANDNRPQRRSRHPA